MAGEKRGPVSKINNRRAGDGQRKNDAENGFHRHASNVDEEGDLAIQLSKKKKKTTS